MGIFANSSKDYSKKTAFKWYSDAVLSCKNVEFILQFRIVVSVQLSDGALFIVNGAKIGANLMKKVTCM